MTDAIKAWGNLVDHIQLNYYKPDIEALAVTLSVATAHQFRQDEPVWLMVVGPPGTGKTKICIGAVLAMPNTYNVDSLTENTFLSGFSKGPGNSNSLLNNIGTPDDRSGILTMADFSAFLGLREEKRREIAGQMRKIYDGYYDRPTGVGWLEWEGKVTIIAAATSGAERTWSQMKSLGERFMCVRWPRGDGVEQARFAFKQIGREKDIDAETAGLVDTLVTVGPIRPVLDDPSTIQNGFAYLAEIAARARATVERELYFRREINAEPEPEGPTRIMKALAQVAVGHAALMRKKGVDDDDYRVARRMGVDSIPPARWKLIEFFRHTKGTVAFAELCRRLLAPPSSLNWALEDLCALGIVELEAGEVVEKSYRLRDDFRELLELARPILEL